jgi:hypothetical protein
MQDYLDDQANFLSDQGATTTSPYVTDKDRDRIFAARPDLLKAYNEAEEEEEKRKKEQEEADKKRREQEEKDAKDAEANRRRNETTEEKRARAMKQKAFERFQQLEKYVDPFGDEQTFAGMSGIDAAKMAGYNLNQLVGPPDQTQFEYDVSRFRDPVTGKIKSELTEMVNINEGKKDIFGRPKKPKFVEQLKPDAIPGYDFSINPVKSNFKSGLGTLTGTSGIKPNVGTIGTKPFGTLGLIQDIIRPETGLQAFNTLEEARKIQDLTSQYEGGDDSAYDEYLKLINKQPTTTGGGNDGPRTMTAPSGPGDPSDPSDPADPAIPTDPVTGQYSNEYFIPGASNFYSNLPSTMFNPTTNMLTLANGGRANFAGGGIADLRQGYFLGKLVKSITKPFKKAFKGFKKIAKSPMGKMALLALGGYYLGGGTGLGGARMFGNTGFSMGKLPGASFFNQPSTKILSNNAIKSPIAEAGPGIFKEAAKTAVDPSGNFLTKSLGFMKDNPLATIMATSGLSGAYTAYLNNKREDETMADYQRRLEIERGNFAPIPVDPVQFAANGGRMGFADGGDDDDDDESFRQKALGALYQKLAMGGSAGLPPVTMQTEGQDTQSFGDDESTGMANATPTMQNQMPMRPPMMDPRMQQQMMQQRMNPMMNRGMMSMQQPRIMAQEGGMMDMGGMEKDYRNEGGFVPIGGQERADDVPARLSKNEFVFTADAVRNAGGGDIDKGAEIMENMMENLEQGGKVSKASQGLSGAREMFATSQRLEEVL